MTKNKVQEKMSKLKKQNFLFKEFFMQSILLITSWQYQ